MKLIIDIPDDEYKQMKDYPSVWNSRFERIIANGTPYNPTGDCISREALKKDIDFQYICKCCHNVNGNVCDICHISEIEHKIDNAPTVFGCKNCKNNGNERYCLDCHDYCNFVRYEARPQGKWEPDNLGFTCNKCGWTATVSEDVIGEYHFCPNCGADMRKGGAK